MPKTNKKFDWEIYDKNGDFLDILSLNRNEAREYQKKFPNHKMQEISYSEDGKYTAW